MALASNDHIDVKYVIDNVRVTKPSCAIDLSTPEAGVRFRKLVLLSTSLLCSNVPSREHFYPQHFEPW